MKNIRVYALFLFALVACISVANLARSASAAKAAPAQPVARSFVLVAHGGAGDYNMTTDQIAVRRDVMVKAIQAGYGILAGGGASLDAVEATIRVMEDSGLFDAGRGAHYTLEGVPEMDAAIMDWRTLNAGSVASLKHIANPIHLARLVMEKTKHVLLVSSGAEEFAKSQGIELVSPYYFFTEREWERYQKAQSAEEKKKSSELLRHDEHGTVGVVALDQAGNLAAGTSTGGTALKMPGRVGDSPIIGAGRMPTMRAARFPQPALANSSCAISWLRISASASVICMFLWSRRPMTW
jgi:beta-aspartyl-peptidase (threonine type)